MFTKMNNFHCIFIVHYQPNRCLFFFQNNAFGPIVYCYIKSIELTC